MLGEEANSYSISGNRYYQRSRTGDNALGYFFKELTPNSAFLFGQCNEMTVTHTASNQAELEAAVAAIDTAPAEVVWSYGAESMKSSLK